MLQSFDHLPDGADCWLYATDRVLTADEIAFMENLFDTFQREWSSHGQKVHGACRVIEGRIIVIAAHVEGGDISGCGIDKSLHLLQEAAQSRSFSWVSALNIVYQDGDGDLQVVTRAQFKTLAAQGAITDSTRVVDLSLRSLGALRSHGLLRTVASSWHARLLPQIENIPG